MNMWLWMDLCRAKRGLGVSPYVSMHRLTRMSSIVSRS